MNLVPLEPAPTADDEVGYAGTNGGWAVLQQTAAAIGDADLARRLLATATSNAWPPFGWPATSSSTFQAAA